MQQVVWITGGGSGLGKALALNYAASGWAVAVSGRRADRLEEVVVEVEALGGAGLAVPLDVTDEAATAAAVAVVLERFGRIDVVVANAGFSVSGRFDRLSAADWRRQLEVNVVGVAITLRAALPAVVETQGRLAAVGSVAGFIAPPGSGAYSASKAAVHILCGSLSAELEGTGVSCTALHPGFVESEIAQVDNDGRFHADRKDPRPQRLMWTGEDAARVMRRAIDRRRKVFVFTGHGKLAVFLARHFPGFTAWLLGRSAVKGNPKALAKSLG